METDLAWECLRVIHANSASINNPECLETPCSFLADVTKNISFLHPVHTETCGVGYVIVEH